jgi:hypothetical protein
MNKKERVAERERVVVEGKAPPAAPATTLSFGNRPPL